MEGKIILRLENEKAASVLKKWLANIFENQFNVIKFLTIKHIHYSSHGCSLTKIYNQFVEQEYYLTS